jgi:predicted MPP superfamily phosphohydrolase
MPKKALVDGFTWVLLSDIHHGDGNKSTKEERENVLRAILQDLEPSGAPWPKLDAIAITGDLAAKGGLIPNEYDEAGGFISRLKAQHPQALQVFAVPGNHDVNRIVDKSPDVRRLVDSLRAGAESLDDVLGDSEADRLRKRQESFWSFFDHHCQGKDNVEFDATGLWWVATVKRESFDVRLIGLNTAILSSGDEDKGRLRLGRKQMNSVSTVDTPQLRTITLLLSHHPLSWLAPDEQEFASAVGRHCHVHLSGHLHSPGTSVSRSPGQKQLLTINSGATHEKHEHGEDRRLIRFDYSVCRLVAAVDGIRFQRWPRVWSVDQAGFVCDSTLCERGVDYSEELLRLQAPKIKTPPPSETIDSVSEDSLHHFGSRRTAYPTEASLLELYEHDTYLASRFQESRAASREASLSAQDIAEAIAAGKANSIILLGEPGAGKSFAALELAKCVQQKFCLPIFLPLFRASESESLAKLVHRYKKLLRQHARLAQGRRRVYFFDGIDETLTTQDAYSFVTEVIRTAAESASVVATCRTRPIEEEWSSFIEEVSFARIYWMAPWNTRKDFPSLLSKLVKAHHITRHERTNIARASGANEAIKRLLQRPLYARMLIFLLGSAAAPPIGGVADLYRAYFERLTTIAARSLKAAGCDLSDQEIGRLWQDFAADAQRDHRIEQEWIKVEKSADGKAGVSTRCFGRAMDHLVEGTTHAVRRGYARLAHYSFFEFLVASRFARIILEATSSEGDRLEMGSDLSPEMRHYLVAMLRQDANVKLPKLLDTAYRRTRADSNPTRMMIGCNLLIYLTSRCCETSISLAILNRLLKSETDPFLLDALHWGLCHSGNPGAAGRAIRRIEDNPALARYTRGYLLYYYGDLPRGVAPPFLDDSDLPWSKARERIAAILGATDYSTTISLERRLIDIYTFLDLAVSHKALATEQEDRILTAAISGLQVTISSKDPIRSIQERKNQFVQAGR